MFKNYSSPIEDILMNHNEKFKLECKYAFEKYPSLIENIR